MPMWSVPSIRVTDADEAAMICASMPTDSGPIVSGKGCYRQESLQRYAELFGERKTCLSNRFRPKNRHGLTAVLQRSSSDRITEFCLLPASSKLVHVLSCRKRSAVFS